MKKKIMVSMMAVAMAGLIVTGCSKPAEKTAEKPADPKPTPAQTTEKPASTSVSGKSADGKLEAKLTVSGSVALIELNTGSIAIQKPPAKDAKNDPAQGHVRITLDSEKPMDVTTKRTSLKDIKPGKHTLKVELMNNDKTPMNIETTLSFETK